MPNPNPKLENLKSYKPKWKLGKTKTIRVPIAIADKVLAYAHQLDEEHSVVSSELIDLKKARAIISEGISCHSKLGGAIKTCLAQLGILLGYKIEQRNRRWTLIETSKLIDIEEIETIISEGLSTSSREGWKIKTNLAQIGNLLGFKIKRKGRGGKWKFTDTSD